MRRGLRYLPRSTMMFSPSHRALSTISPSRSTPSLDYDNLEYEPYFSPPDDYLATPDISEWKETRKLEEQKLRIEAADAVGDVQFQCDLPSLDILSQYQRPLLSELPSPTQWPHATIAPKDAFPDYDAVRRFLEDQDRPSSPSAFSSASSSSYLRTPYHDHDQLPYDEETSFIEPYGKLLLHAEPTPCTSADSPAPITLPSIDGSARRVGRKAKREEDSDYEPALKRRLVTPVPGKDKFRTVDVSGDSDVDDEAGADLDGLLDDDESGEFLPARRLAQTRFKPPAIVRGTTRPATSSSARRRVSASSNRRAAVQAKTKSNRGEDYQVGPCNCRDSKCGHCQMTCFYTFVHGPRTGEVCRRLFEINRHLDLKRHKATHAVQEWKWLQDGDILPKDAYWHFVVFEGKEHGLICPNGHCTTTFTRYDALKRHMERGTCHHMSDDLDLDGLDNRQVKAKVIRESDAKYLRMTEAKHT
ncbi:hypothetical protein K439DRAFT_1657352 [Ramaria rubella]|nr:hypothetical protein K439DRAFT_1657352 [Ramaria rubella]